MDKTLYISDLDGTLLNSKAKISRKTSVILNDLISRGLLFSYATARSFSSARKITGSLNLSLPLATYNGAFLIDPKDGNIIESRLMDKSKIETVFKLIRSLKICPLIYSMLDGKERVSWIRNRENEGIRHYLECRKGDERLRPVFDYESLFAGEVFYITIIGPYQSVDSLRPFFQNNEHIYFHIQQDTYRKDEFWLEIFRFDATKESAVLRIKRYVKAHRIICFGDNTNDLTMFRVSDQCYAVSNANSELKKIATDMILSNDEDGVALWLKNHVGWPFHSVRAK